MGSSSVFWATLKPFPCSWLRNTGLMTHLNSLKVCNTGPNGFRKYFRMSMNHALLGTAEFASKQALLKIALLA
jgi:hypothetical protein